MRRDRDEEEESDAEGEEEQYESAREESEGEEEEQRKEREEEQLENPLEVFEREEESQSQRQQNRRTRLQTTEDEEEGQGQKDAGGTNGERASDCTQPLIPGTRTTAETPEEEEWRNKLEKTYKATGEKREKIKKLYIRPSNKEVVKVINEVLEKRIEAIKKTETT